MTSFVLLLTAKVNEISTNDIIVAAYVSNYRLQTSAMQETRSSLNAECTGPQVRVSDTATVMPYFHCMPTLDMFPSITVQAFPIMELLSWIEKHVYTVHNQ